MKCNCVLYIGNMVFPIPCIPLLYREEKEGNASPHQTTGAVLERSTTQNKSALEQQLLGSSQTRWERYVLYKIKLPGAEGNKNKPKKIV